LQAFGAGTIPWRTTPLVLRVGVAIVVAHVLMAIFGSYLVAYGPGQMMTGLPLSGASLQHPFGVDQLGRDVFSRTVHGAGLVLTLSLSGTLLGFVIGTTVGLLCGYVGGWWDRVTMRIVEALISIPTLFFALLIVALISTRVVGSGTLIVAVIGFVYAPRVSRIARTAAIEIAITDYVQAARLRGDRAWRVATREILPNAIGTLSVEFALRSAYAPVLIASLGFLGFGLQPPTPEWGLIISENRNLIYTTPATVLGPGLVLASLVIGINLMTEGTARMVGQSAARVQST
jgi:peptide/nickel transport system permease protein